MLEEQINNLFNPAGISKPVIIWGTKTAGKICYLCLKKLNINIVAAGDNNFDAIGKKLYDIPILSLSEIQIQYPDALIVIGSFLENISNSIITQLKSTGNKFTFCKFDLIGYLYEILYLNRNIKDRNRLAQIINNITYDSNEVWRRKINKGVMLEYRYIVKDEMAYDLKNTLSKIYGIKSLVLIISADKINASKILINELFNYENIGHIITVLDSNDKISLEELQYFASRVFYIVCDERISKKLWYTLAKCPVVVETKKLSDELFYPCRTESNCIVTEEVIVKSVLLYVGKKRENSLKQKHLSQKPIYIVQLFNGLANQMLMYLFGRFLEEESDRIVIFDDTILSLDIADEEENISRIYKWNKALSYEQVQKGVSITKEKNSFYKFERAEVAEVFDIPIRLLSDYFDRSTWSMYLEKIKKKHSYKYTQSYPLCHVLIENGVDIPVIKDSVVPDEFLPVQNSFCMDTYSWERPYVKKNITDFIVNLKNAYFIGIWATGKVEDWFFHNRKWVSNVFKFRLKLDKKNRDYAEKICKSDSVIIHIRRGDFAFFKMTPRDTYFRKTLELIEKEEIYKDKKYFIFSDDLKWCQEHKKVLGLDKLEDKVIYVSGNTGVDNYLDMYLMSLGKIMIPTPVSSFSYMAILLSDTIEKCVCIPKYFYELSHGQDIQPWLMNIKNSEKELS